MIDFPTARRLAERHGTPLLVLSVDVVRGNLTDLRTSLPGVGVHYAIKANPAAEVLEVLAGEGIDFDVSSIGEIDAVMRLGVGPEQMLYTKPVNKESELREAHRRGIRWFVVDNRHEILKVARCAPHSNVLVRLRVRTRDAVVDLSYKFGAPPADALGLIGEARAANLAVRGLSFHVGSQCTNPYTFVDTIITCRTIFNDVASTGPAMDTLDIGGGFPISYLTPVMPIEQFCDPIRHALERYFGSYRVIAEPGRFIVGDAVTLVTQVIGKSVRDDIAWYYVDDGLYGSFSGRLYDHCDYAITVDRQGPRHISVIAGPTCDSFDVIYANRALPDLEIGDLLLVAGMGAYTNASATDFNGLPRATLTAV